MNKKRLQLTVARLLALAGAAMLLYACDTRQPVALENATQLPEPLEIKAFELTDERGSSLTQDDLLDRWTLVFFGFTRCPDICPVTLQQLLTARVTLQKQGVVQVPDILFVSVDPARDTVEALASYVDSFNGELRGARAELPALRQFTGNLGIFFEQGPGPAERYQVNHSAAVLLINPRGALHAIFSAPQNVQALVHDLPIVMAAF
ncbi:MAG: SCO family protein [Woeseia sp.]|nr:SCO family protein [Woeseia sp.]